MEAKQLVVKSHCRRACGGAHVLNLLIAEPARTVENVSPKLTIVLASLMKDLDGVVVWDVGSCRRIGHTHVGDL